MAKEESWAMTVHPSRCATEAIARHSYSPAQRIENINLLDPDISFSALEFIMIRDNCEEVRMAARSRLGLLHQED